MMVDLLIDWCLVDMNCFLELCRCHPGCFVDGDRRVVVVPLEVCVCGK